MNWASGEASPATQGRLSESPRRPGHGKLKQDETVSGKTIRAYLSTLPDPEDHEFLPLLRDKQIERSRPARRTKHGPFVAEDERAVSPVRGASRG